MWSLPLHLTYLELRMAMMAEKIGEDELHFRSSLFLVGPRLTIRGIRTIRTFVVLVGDLAPVGREHRATRGLIALDHRAARCLIRPSVDLLEQTVKGCITLRLLVGELLIDILVNLTPITLDL